MCPIAYGTQRTNQIDCSGSQHVPIHCVVGAAQAFQVTRNAPMR